MRRGHAMVLTLALLVAQLAIAMHPLHLTAKQDGQKIELTCAFCIAGSHHGVAPSAPTIHVERVAHAIVAAAVDDVCEFTHLVSPRLTRGPPFSVTRA